MKCLIPFCKNYTNTHPEGVRFYRITKDRYAEWMSAIKRMPEPSPNYTRRICSEHFAPDSFMQIGKKMLVRRTAVPTLKLRPVPCNKMLLVKKPDLMGKKCSLNNCNNYYHEFSTLTFHELPYNEDDRRRWLNAIPKGLLQEGVKNIIICSAHFSLDNYQPATMGLTKRMLRKTATPNQFMYQEAVDDYEKENNRQEIKKETVNVEVQTTYQRERSKNYERNELLQKIRYLQKRLDRQKAKILLMKSQMEHLVTHGFYKEGNIGKVIQNQSISGSPEISDEEDEDLNLANNITSHSEMVWIKCRTCCKKSHLKLSSSITEKFLLGKSFKEVILSFVPQMATTILVDDVICFSCSEILKSFARFIKKCVTIEDVLKQASEQKKEILGRNGEVDDTFDNTSIDIGDNDLEVFEEVEVITEDDNNTINQTVDLEGNERFEIIEAGLPYPIKNHDRVISITQTNEILAEATNSDIDIYRYDTTKGEVANKRILFFGSVIVQCPKCKIILKHDRELKNHIESVHCDMELTIGENNKACNYALTKEKSKKSSAILPCPVCKINVYTNRLLIKHLNSVHENYKPYKCDKCGASFKTKYSQARHVQKYEEFGSCDFRKCYFCSEMISRKDYRSHSKTHTKSFVCNECGKAFVTAYHLKCHSVKHRIKKDNQQLCPVCGQMKTNLYAHLQTHEAGPKKYMCHKCPKFFTAQGQLKRHITTIHLGIRKYQCTECKMKFSTNDYLKEHYKLKHSDNFSHICEVCGRGFSRHAYLKKHVNVHLSNRRSPRRKYRFAFDVVECKYCFKQFKTLHSLRIHLFSHMTRLRYKCNFCSLTFSCSSNKYRHEQRHKLPYYELSCEVCFKRMGTKEELDKHMVKHEGAKKYKCQYCEASYARQYLLNQHIFENHTSLEDIEEEKQTVLADALEEFLL